MTTPKGTSEALSRSALIVGMGADAEHFGCIAAQFDDVIHYSFERAVSQNGPRSVSNVVDIASGYRETEEQAWGWTVSLLDALTTRVPALDPGLLESMRRALFTSGFVPVAEAMARAERVSNMLVAGADVAYIGLHPIEIAALKRYFEAPQGPDSADFQAASMARTAPTRPDSGLRHARALSLVSAIARVGFSTVVAWLTSLPARVRAGRVRRNAGSGHLAAVLVGQTGHLPIIEATLEELRHRGWILAEVDVWQARRPSPVLSTFHSSLCLGDFVIKGSFGQLALRRRVLAQLRTAVAEWMADAGLESYEPFMRTRVESVMWSVNELMGGHRRMLASLRPDVVLSTNETDLPVESCVVPARSLSIPTVDVQHGVIAETRRRADFRFDAFCVFGDGYAEALTAMGTAPERIRVVGNPTIDALATTAGTARTAQSSHSDDTRMRIMFAAQYSGSLLPDIDLFRTLDIVLEYLEGAPTTRLIIKLHPLGVGREKGYDVAFAAHPDADVECVRDTPTLELMSQCDCIVTYSSTVGLDAAYLHIPTIIINPAGPPDWLPLVDEGTALRATNAEEFGQCVEAVRRGERIGPQAYERVARRYGLVRDGQAADRIANVCEELSGRDASVCAGGTAR